jgi:hypothetical protein
VNPGSKCSKCSKCSNCAATVANAANAASAANAARAAKASKASKAGKAAKAANNLLLCLFLLFLLFAYFASGLMNCFLSLCPTYIVRLCRFDEPKKGETDSLFPRFQNNKPPYLTRIFNLIIIFVFSIENITTLISKCRQNKFRSWVPCIFLRRTE